MTMKTQKKTSRARVTSPLPRQPIPKSTPVQVRRADVHSVSFQNTSKPLRLSVGKQAKSGRESQHISQNPPHVSINNGSLNRTSAASKDPHRARRGIGRQNTGSSLPYWTSPAARNNQNVLPTRQWNIDISAHIRSHTTNSVSKL